LKIILFILALIIVFFLISNNVSDNKIQSILLNNIDQIEQYQSLLMKIEVERQEILNLEHCSIEQLEQLRELICDVNKSIINFCFWDEKLKDYLEHGKHQSFAKEAYRISDEVHQLFMLYEKLYNLKIETISNSEIEEEIETPVISNSYIYFDGCKTEEDVNKRYHALVKIYHPDAGGSNDTFIYVKEEYDRVLKEMKNVE